MWPCAPCPVWTLRLSWTTLFLELTGSIPQSWGVGAGREGRAEGGLCGLSGALHLERETGMFVSEI